VNPDPALPHSGSNPGNFDSAVRQEAGDARLASRNVLRGVLGVGFGAAGAFTLLILDGARGLVPVVFAVGILFVLWVVERLGVLRQPNGAFCAVGVVSVFASLAGLSDSAYQRYGTRLKTMASQEAVARTLDPVEAVSGPKSRTDEFVPLGASVQPASPLPVPTVGQDPRMAAIEEARRRFPAIWVLGSPENNAFREAAEQLKRSGPDLLKEPDWVLRLAESLAREEGWGTQPAGALPGESKGAATIPSPEPVPPPAPAEGAPR
jgi:hypothetical protein